METIDNFWDLIEFYDQIGSMENNDFHRINEMIDNKGLHDDAILIENILSGAAEEEEFTPEMIQRFYNCLLEIKNELLFK